MLRRNRQQLRVLRAMAQYNPLRVRKLHRLGLRFAHVREMPRTKGALHIGGLGRVTAEQPMLTTTPEITFTRDGIDWQWRGFVSILAIQASIGGGQQTIQFHAGEAKHVQIHRGIVSDARRDAPRFALKLLKSCRKGANHAGLGCKPSANLRGLGLHLSH
jgi:hypothetical protein